MAAQLTLQRLHKLIWLLIYGGVFTLILRIANARPHAGAGRRRRRGSSPCKQPGRPIARFPSDPSGKCLAGRSTALRRLPIARAIGGAPPLASHPGKALVRLQKNFEQALS